MPFPRNWVEELASEWLVLKGYLVESNVRLRAKERGGVAEADVIGIKVEYSQLQIMHIETGSLAKSYKDNLDWVENKFNKDNQQCVESFAKRKVPWDSGTKYKCMFVASSASRASDLKDALSSSQIQFWMLDRFIEEMALPALQDWKKEQVKVGLRKTNNPTLPECLWLLQLVDFLELKQLLKKPQVH